MCKGRKSGLLVVILVQVWAQLSAGKPGETQRCLITGDLSSNGIVEVGVNVPEWVTRDLQGHPAGLWIDQNLLYGLDRQGYLPADYYLGHTRVLKKQPRMDFEFSPDGAACLSPTEGDIPPFWLDGDGLCAYRIVILDGFYDRRADSVAFDAAARVLLMDYTLGTPCSQTPQGEPCVEDYQVGAGPVSVEGILFEFQSQSGDDESNENGGFCKDTMDNDGDGLVDCDDPDCTKWCR